LIDFFPSIFEIFSWYVFRVSIRQKNMRCSSFRWTIRVFEVSFFNIWDMCCMLRLLWIYIWYLGHVLRVVCYCEKKLLCLVVVFFFFFFFFFLGFDYIRYLREIGCKWNALTCRNAAYGGHLDCLKYLHLSHLYNLSITCFDIWIYMLMRMGAIGMSILALGLLLEDS
jgi:hypothetical protein